MGMRIDETGHDGTAFALVPWKVSISGRKI
jgi:hypothetical protein